MDGFSTTSERNGDITIVTISGRVDSVTAATLDAELAKVVHDNKKIILDLKDVEYMSSAGIRAVVRAVKVVEKAKGSLKLASISKNVAEVLETVGMLGRMQTYSSVDEAIASF